jgi:glycopeptide antibiotics resistance protein
MEMQIVLNNLGIPTWPIGILLLAGVLIVLWRRKHGLPYLGFFAIFWVYVLFGLDKTFFPIQINGNFVDVMRQAPLWSQVNLLPFHFSKYGLSSAGYIGLLENILLTVPCGFGLNFIRRLKLKEALWLSIGVGLGIEAVQFGMTLILRYPYRVVDINDVLLNALGVLLGYGLFRVFARLYMSVLPLRVERKRADLLAYLDYVTDGKKSG